MIDEIEMSEKHLTKLKYNWFSKNPQAIILYDIIQDRLPFNYLQSVVVEKTLNHIILNKRYQYHYRSD